jgi:mannosylglycoprotein endo-beta-mannosidase
MPALLLKLDISKAFDSVRWDYLISLMQHRGFPPKWCNWIAAILSTSTSRVLLNGTPLPAIQHGRGLRQGDPLSPLLFVLAIDPLQKLIEQATATNLLSKLGSKVAIFSVSLYADDAAIFMKPTKKDVINMERILRNFGEASGLRTNLQKTQLISIRCQNVDLHSLLLDLPVTRTSFPLRYLGLSLSVRSLKKVDFQPLMDKATRKLSVWAGRNLTQAGRVSLTKSVLSSQPVYFLTAVRPNKKILEDLDKLRRCFLWAGDKQLTGGKCKVNWTRSCLPKENGGLGIPNLDKFARALRLRWLWHQWVSTDKPWVGTETPCDDEDKLLFAACTTITIGDGKKANFWESGWLQGRRPKDIAPNLFKISRKKKRSVHDALSNDTWIRDLNINGRITNDHLASLVLLWNLVRATELQSHLPDTITWKLTKSGE